MNSKIVEVKNLTKIFDTKKAFSKPESFTAVDNISFDLHSGEILGFLGPNGAGKTTTIQMLLGLLTPTSGSISYFGKDFFTNKTQIMEKISFASSYLKLPSALSVLETLEIYGQLYCLPTNLRKERIAKNLEFFKLEKLKNRLTKHLSAGQLTRLMLAKAFLPEPSIILLDEPTAALDPDIAYQIRKYILEKQTEGLSVLFTSHNMYEVEEMCDRILVLKEGRIIASETPKNLASAVKVSHVQLFITSRIEALINLLEHKNLSYKLEGNFVNIDVAEDKISNLLLSLSKQEIEYNQISIKKPTLEDYFLEISR